MKFQTTLITIVFFFFSFQQLFGQTISGTSNQDAINYDLDFTNVVPLDLGDGFIEPPSAPFYRIFWMYGDGNFEYGVIRYPGNQYNHSHTYLTPADGTPIIYSNEALVKERKTDKVPPDNLISLPPSSVSSFSPGAVADYINNSETIIEGNPIACPKVGIINSHLFIPPDGRPKYYYIEDSTETAFALAYKPEMPGKLLFFYPDEDDTNADIFMNEKYGGKPNFTPSVNYGGTFIDNNTQGISANAFGINSYYNKVIEKEFDYTEVSIDNFFADDGEEELRAFHILKSDIVEEEAIYRFMVMMVSYDSLEWVNCGNMNYTTGDNIFVNGYVATNGQVKNPNGDLPTYFVDADTISLKGGEPKDPNSLRVTDICCCDSPNCDDYLVSFELIFQNEETALTYKSSIIIEDLVGEFDCITLQDQAIVSERDGMPGTVKNWDADCKVGSDQSIYALSNADYFCVDYSPSPLGLFNKARFRFTARTNQVGLNALLDYNALKACVVFHEVGDTVCTTNIPLDTTKCESIFPNKPLPLDSNLFSSKGAAKTNERMPIDSCDLHHPDYKIWRDRNNSCAAICDSCCITLWCKICTWLIDNIWFVLIGFILFLTSTFLWRKNKKLDFIE